MPSLVEMLAGKVARMRVRKAELKKRQSELLKMLEENPTYAELVAVNLELSSLAALLPSAEIRLRQEAVAEAATTGEKKTPVYTIKNYTKVAYTQKDAVEWCIEHFKEALVVDPDKFEQAAEAIKPDFVKITTEQRASLSSDLSAYVETPEEDEKTEEVPY